MATGNGGKGNLPSQESREDQQPPLPNYAPGGRFNPANSGQHPPPPRSGYAPPPLGFHPPPPPPPPMGVRPPPPPPPKFHPQTNPTLQLEHTTSNSPEEENYSQKNLDSQPVQDMSVIHNAVRNRWDKKEDDKTVAKSRWDNKGTDGEEKAERDKPEGQMKKIKMGLGKRSGMGSISMKLKPQADAVKKPKLESALQGKPASSLVAKAFGSDSDEDEEMPPEAKLRMRNVGRDTPTSAGPNSFYKTAKGFTDPRGSWRNELEND